MGRLKPLGTALILTSVLCAADLAADSSAKLPAIPIPKTEMVVTPPIGWTVNEAIWSTAPRAYFKLETRNDDRMYPSLEIEALLGRKSPKSFSDYFNGKRFKTFVVSPRHITISGFPAVEFSFRETVVVDFVGGGGATDHPIVHIVLLKSNNGFYTCAMTADADRYQPYRYAPTALCASLRSQPRKSSRSNNSFKPKPLRGSA